jgi:hypothetical protein
MQAGNESLPLGATGTGAGWRMVKPVAAALLAVARRIAGALERSCQLRARAAQRPSADIGLSRAEFMTGNTESLGRKDVPAGEPWPVAIIHDDLSRAA